MAEGRPFARHWVHNGWVEVEGTKMSKSLGNFTSLTDLLSRVDGRAYRVLVLRAHYRSPIEVTPETVADAEKALERLDVSARRFGLPDLLAPSERGYVVAGEGKATNIDPGALAMFRDRMDDDMDTPGALAGIFELVSRVNSAADADDEAGAAELAQTAAVLLAALGVSLRVESPKSTRPPPNWWRHETRRERPRTSPAPTCCVMSWSPWAGRWRTRRRGRRSGASR